MSTKSVSVAPRWCVYALLIGQLHGHWPLRVYKSTAPYVSTSRTRGGGNSRRCFSHTQKGGLIITVTRRTWRTESRGLSTFFVNEIPCGVCDMARLDGYVHRVVAGPMLKLVMSLRRHWNLLQKTQVRTRNDLMLQRAKGERV